jgi:hypothetical protein
MGIVYRFNRVNCTSAFSHRLPHGGPTSTPSCARPVEPAQTENAESPGLSQITRSGPGGGREVVSRPLGLLGHEARKEHVDLGPYGGAFRGPVEGEVVGCGVVGAYLAVWAGADESARSRAGRG